MRELAAAVDAISKSLVKDMSTWKNQLELLAGEEAGAEALAAQLAELDEAALAERVTAAEGARDAAQGVLDAALAGVQAAENELAGAEAGDGRDASNRSLQERLADAQNAQVGEPPPRPRFRPADWAGNPCTLEA